MRAVVPNMALAQMQFENMRVRPKLPFALSNGSACIHSGLIRQVEAI
jgi:hypothetical protein